MRPILFDSGVRFDDVNARWGSPSYLLEPGDPGYVPDPNSASFPHPQPKTKRSSMPLAARIKRAEDELSQQMDIFASNIGGHATTFGISSTDVGNIQKDAARFKWELQRQKKYLAYAQALTKWKDIMRKGGTAEEPNPPTLDEEPEAVLPGIETRFRAWVTKVTTHAAYNDSVGEELGILGDEQGRPDPDSIKPEVKVPAVKGDGVFVGWGWGGYREEADACEGRVDRNDGQGEKLLTIDTTPGYLDTHPIPSTPQKWIYRWILRKGDQRIGQWVTVSVNVG
jgi:hypothetical protein